MLTPEQIEIRRTGIGASEVSALLELNPYAGAIDVWLRKPTTTRAPLVLEDESPAAEVGSVLEDGIRELYQRRTGRRVVAPHATFRHPDAAHVLASPDGFDDERGLEIKLVGSNMAHHWEGDSVPDYVLVQCAQNMAVCERPRWDVAALIGGTDLRILTVDRDADLEASILEIVEDFWTRYVDGDRPPPIRDVEERKRYLAARYPGSEKTACRAVDTPKAARAARALERAKRSLKRAEEREKRASLAMLEMVRNDYGIEGPWGKYIAPAVRGRVDWKAIAEELGGAGVPIELIERNRGEGFRSPRFYPPKEG